MKKIFKLYEEMLKKYGDPEEIWPQWCAKEKNGKTREMVAIGAVLTQRTSWHNAEIVINNLAENNLLSLERISKLPDTVFLAQLTRPAGFYNTKPKRLIELATYIVKSGGFGRLVESDTCNLRNELLKVYGIGSETADTLLLFALDKPSFVIDEYTKRFAVKHQLAEKLDYHYLKYLFEDSLPRDVAIYQNYHALIIVDQKGLEKSKMKKVEI